MIAQAIAAEGAHTPDDTEKVRQMIDQVFVAINTKAEGAQIAVTVSQPPFFAEAPPMLARLYEAKVKVPQRQAMKKMAQLQIGYLKHALQAFFLDNHRYPTTAEGLEALRTAPADMPRWDGPYIEDEDIEDPWENPIRYESVNEDSYKISSDGPDGKPGTDDDIVGGTER